MWQTVGGVFILALLFGNALNKSYVSSVGERVRYAESLMPETSEIQYFTSGAESEILNVALPEEEEDSVTCDAIVGNILADASFTAEMKSHGFTHLGCGVVVAPIVFRETREPKCCGLHAAHGGTDDEIVQSRGHTRQP